MAMYIIPPVTITNGSILSTNAPLSIYPTYSSVTHYVTGDRVYYNTVDYEAVANSHNVLPGSVGSELIWAAIGQSNRYSPFDGVIGRTTIGPAAGTPLEYEIYEPITVNGCRFENVAAKTITVIVTDPVEGVVYNNSFSMVDNSEVNNIYDYVFSPIEYKTELTVLDLPNYPMSKIKFIIDNEAEVAQLGEFIMGYQHEIGAAINGTSVGTKSYSSRERDQYGNVKRTRRRPTKVVSFKVELPTDAIEAVRKRLERYENELVLFIGDPEVPATHILGYYEDFEIPFEGFSLSRCSIEVEGII